MRLSQLLEGINVINMQGDASIHISGVVFDSRRAHAETLFVCLPGAHTDGTQYIMNAVQAGAHAVICQSPVLTLPQNICVVQVADARTALSQIAHRFFNKPSLPLKVVGITGTNGKTTLTYLLESIFKAQGENVGVVGTIQYRYPGVVIEADRTTPEASELQAMLAQMRQAQVSHVAMEVSSHALELKRVDDVHFDVGILTNITQDHLDFHGDMHHYIKSKAKLFALMSEQKKPGATAVINGDDSHCGAIVETVRRLGKLKLRTFGWSQRCDFRVNEVRFEHHGLVAEVWDATLKQSHCIQSSLVGRHNLANCLAAIAAARALNIPWTTIQKGIAGLGAVPGRLQCLNTDHGVSLYVDYAHTDDALENVLLALQAIRSDSQGGRGRIITVFGCGGDRDRSKRPRMGEVAMRLSDRVIVTSDNPRNEEPLDIIDAICGTGNLTNCVVPTENFLKQKSARQSLATKCPDRREAIALALDVCENGDLILIAGKGHEVTQEIRGSKHPFSDIEVSQQAIRKLGWKIVFA